MVNHTVALGAAFHIFHILIHSGTLRRSCHLVHQIAFGRKHKESDAEHRIGTRGEYGEIDVAVGHLDKHFGTFRTTYPVFLRLFD